LAYLFSGGFRQQVAYHRVTAAGLGGVKGFVGSLQEQPKAVAAAKLGDADADPHFKLILEHYYRHEGHRLAQPFRNFDNAESRKPAEQDRKFFTAEPRQLVLMAQHGLQPCRDLPQHVVPSLMPVTIVNGLKIIDVQHHRGNGF
jgi:hypothetical protein